MDPMVSARIPGDLLSEVNSMLQRNGNTTTQLIRSAYRAYRDTGRLPDENEGERNGGSRILTEEQARHLRESLDRATRPVPESYFDGRSYDDIIAEEMAADYEALA